MNLTLKLLIFTIALINQSFGLPANATKNNNNLNLVNINNTKSENISRLLSFTVGNCLVKQNISRCLKKYFIQILNECVKDNNTWEFGDFITIEKNSEWDNNNINLINSTKLRSDDELNDELKIKMNQLIESRSIRFSPANVGKSEGRKKKDKGGMALIGGMAMAGMMMQMFMGKMLMIAGAAFIMAKLALFFSVLNSLKKSGGGGHDSHVIYTDGGGGGGGGGHGWNRQYGNAFPEELVHAQNRQVFI